MIARGMKTLELRIERQNGSALKNRKLPESSIIRSVMYFILVSNLIKDMISLKNKCAGLVGIMSFSLDGGYELVKKFLPEP